MTTQLPPHGRSDMELALQSPEIPFEPSPEVLFEEARRRRRRWKTGGALFAAAAIVGALIFGMGGGGTGGSGAQAHGHA